MTTVNEPRRVISGTPQDLIEKWFAWYGVPHFIKGFGKDRDVFAESAPILIVMFPAQVLAEALIGLPWSARVAMAAAALLVFAAWYASRPREPLRFRAWMKRGALSAVFVLIGPAAALASGATLVTAGWATTANAALLMAVLAWKQLMLGSVLGWVARRTVHEFVHLGTLAARGVPMLTILTLLAFLSNDVWHVAAGMGDLRLLGVLALFVILGLVFLWVRLAEEIESRVDTEDKARRLFNEKEIRDAWDDAGKRRERKWWKRFHGWVHSHKLCAWWPHRRELPPIDELPCSFATVRQSPDLKPKQLRNMRFYLMFCQMIQVGLLTVVVWVFFLILGWLAITDHVVKDWFNGKPPQHPGRLLTIPIPVFSTQLLDASALLAILSGVFFAVSSLTDEGFRNEFFKRTIEDLMCAVGVRCGYLVMLKKLGAVDDDADGADPASEPDSPAHPVRTEQGSASIS